MLVMLTDVSHSDPEKDRRSCMKRGMVLAVRDDGWGWGRLENKAQWIAEGNDPAQWEKEGFWGIIKVPGFPEAPFREIEFPQRENDQGALNPVMGPRGNPRFPHYRIRAWKFDFAEFDPSVEAQMRSAGEVTVSIGDFRKALKRIRDGGRFQ